MASDIYNTGASNVNSAANAGNTAINSFDPNAWQTATNTGLSGIKSSQDSTQNDFFNAFKNQIATQPSATDYYNKGMDVFNVKPLQDTANTLNNTMLTTPNTNLDAARGFNYDAGQVGQKTTQDLERLAPAAAAAAATASTANTNALQYANNGIQQNNMNLIPYQSQEAYLMDSFARQQSGFTTTQQAQLTALTDKMKAGQQLSSDEMAAYSQLSSAEASYQGALASANAQMEAAKTTAAGNVKAAQIGQQYQPVNAGQTLINTANGSTYRAR